MSKIKLKLTIGAQARRVDYCNLEGRRLRPDDYFTLKKGEWVAEFTDFPIDADNDLDLLLVVVGNPRTTCTLTVEINALPALSFSLDEAFNNSGYGAFTQQISVPTTALQPLA